jgi:hypothetical protein
LRPEQRTIGASTTFDDEVFTHPTRRDTRRRQNLLQSNTGGFNEPRFRLILRCHFGHELEPVLTVGQQWRDGREFFK